MFGVPHINCPSCGTSMPYTAAACPGCRRRMVGGFTKSLARGSSASRAKGSWLAGLGPTPFAECRTADCHFLVGERAEKCPDCGAPRASAADPDLARAHRGLVAFFAFFVVMLAAVALFGDGFVCPAVGLGGLAALTSLLFLWPRGRGAPHAPASAPGMRLNAQTAIQRLVEIRQRQRQVESALEHAERHDAGRAAALREPLEAAQESLRRQHALYSLKVLEIEAARWQNKLSPLIYGLDDLTFEQNENRLKAVEAGGRDGLALREKAEGMRALLGGRAEFEEFARKLDETLLSCERIREALVSRQALLALRSVSPLEDAVRGQQAAALGPDDIEVFNLQVSLTNLSASFDELEDEYRRLREEADVGERVRRALGA